ncbi:MAG: hypothetical protein ACI81R_002089 [Bradymonadia bacterium]|jgi:hypothetical protein
MSATLKKRLKALAIVVLVLSPIWGSVLAWWGQPTSPRSVVVVNYTVPYENYQVHSGLMWVLDHARVRPPMLEGSWRPAFDYVGYQPTDRDLPTRLSEISLEPYDTIYLSDAYGVYEADLQEENLRQQRPHLEYSTLLFGGYNAADLDALGAHVVGGGDVIAEFNCLGAPTATRESELLQRMLGVRWSGWSGRVFSTLVNEQEVPPWVRDQFAAQYPDRALPDEPSLLLVHRDGTLIVWSADSLDKVVPLLRSTPEGRQRLGSPSSDAPYFGWFALVEAVSPTLTAATLNLPAMTQNSLESATHGLASSYAAITLATVGESDRLYLAFDASNLDELPRSYRVRWLSKWMPLLHRRHDVWSAQPAFWQVYVPMMLRFMRETP